MLVICNGMPRSASTWSFTVAMEILRRCPPFSEQQAYGGYDENTDKFLKSLPEGTSNAVLKCHKLDDMGKELVLSGTTKVIYTWRDITDAIVSAMNMFGYGFEHATSLITDSLELYRFHRSSGQCLVLSYKEIVSRPKTATIKIAQYLGAQIDDESEIISAIANDLSLAQMSKKLEESKELQDKRRAPHIGQILYEQKEYDPGALLALHIRNGQTGYGAEQLSPEQLKRISAIKQHYGLRE